jgi:RNA polymerase sigma-70 factor (ECF subfamily)
MSDSNALALELSSNLAWLTGLARSLVGDSAADDLVQETVENTLKNPPTTDRPLRPWLRTVMGNVARGSWRSSTRRDRREQAADAPLEAAPADASLARLEISQKLMNAVLTLDEPYRAAIVRRYVDGLSAAEIAREQEVPAATVRSRIKRGLEMLRTDLDGQSGGDREAWRLAVAPLLVPAKAPAVAGTSALVTKIALGLVAAAAVVVVVGYALQDAPEPPNHTAAAAAAGASESEASEDPATVTEPTRKGIPPRRFADDKKRLLFAERLAKARKGPKRRRKSTYDFSGSRVPAGADFPETTPDRGKLDKNYIKDRIAEVIPLVRECYELALSEDETLAGAVKVKFTIDAEEEVGGYVAEALVDEESELFDESLNECITETMLSIEFKAPEGGGTVDVHYPFIFSTEGKP